MAQLTFLGSSNAVPAPGHDNSYLIIRGSASTVLVDCSSSPILKLRQVGVDPTQVQYLVLTHRHPDHLYGYPILILDLWLLGAIHPLQVFGNAETLATAQALLQAFKAGEWPGYAPPIYHEVLPGEGAIVLDLPDLLVQASPAEHSVPALALRFTDRVSNGVVAYSTDTIPSDRVVRLAQGADVLIHEATGGGHGHSTAAQAGEVARRAHVCALYLIHYDATFTTESDLIAQAHTEFEGEIRLARDLESFEF